MSISSVFPLTTSPVSTNGTAPTSHVDASDIRGELMRISPQMAVDLLKNRLPNRPVSKSRVRVMIEDLRAGRWVDANGESIILDQDLRLLDGQHRLMACAESGIAITAVVVVGVDPAVMPSIDGGKPKVAGDFLSMLGLAQSKELAGAARWLCRLERQTMRVVAVGLRNDELGAYVTARPSLSTALPWGRMLRDLLPQSCASMLYFVMAQKAPALAKRYFDDLAHGTSLTQKDPAHVLRDKLLKDKSPRNHAGVVARGALIALGWRAIRNEKSLPQGIVWRGVSDAHEPFPQIL